MPIIPSDGGSGDMLQVNTQLLHDAAPTFSQTSRETFVQHLNLDVEMQLLMGDIMLVAELSRFASALEHFYERLNASLHCVANEAEHIGQAVNAAAEGYDITEGSIASSLKPTQISSNGIKPVRPQIPIINPIFEP
ncbi:MAG: hypothetical protein JO031_04845 [Ktedonobacteraceae bacterium]|nr:hypothetical protein [Ktedonobacteraceae bacterium]